MKVTFEGNTIHDILADMTSMLAVVSNSEKISSRHIPVQGPGPEVRAQPEPVKTLGDIFGDKPVDIPVEKPARTDKQLENDERLRVLAKAKLDAKKAAKAAAAPKSDPMIPVQPPPPKTAEGMDPAEVVKVRQKTIEDLQSAYANGFQKEVFELLSRFGNGAKSFRELPPDAFVPIREAIDNGALT